MPEPSRSIDPVPITTNQSPAAAYAAGPAFTLTDKCGIRYLNSSRLKSLTVTKDSVIIDMMPIN